MLILYENSLKFPFPKCETTFYLLEPELESFNMMLIKFCLRITDVCGIKLVLIYLTNLS